MTTTSNAATALTGTYLLVPGHTRLGFVARHAMGPKVRGAFESFAGRAYLDFARPERSRAEVTIDVASVNTHNARRDKDLRAKYFDATSHPQIAFRSTSVHRLEHDRLRLTGELTIRGHTRPFTIDFSYAGSAKDPSGNTLARFEGRAALNRTDWGVTWIAALDSMLVSNKITLELEVAAVQTDTDQ